MAVEFIVQLGDNPVPGATSFCSLEKADQFHENRGTSAAKWADLTDDQKKTGLNRATEFINNEINFRGFKRYNEDDLYNPQYLVFPRIGLYDSHRRAISDTPEGVQRATAVLAVYAAINTLYPNEDSIVAGEQRIKKREKLGPLEDEWDVHRVQNIRYTPYYQEATGFLRRYMKVGGTITR